MSLHLTTGLLFVLCGAAPDPRIEQIAPLVGPDVAAVGHLDLVKIDGNAEFATALAGGVGESQARENARWATALRRAGAKDLFLLWDPGFGEGPVGAVPLAEGTDAAAIGRLLSGAADLFPPFDWSSTERIGNLQVAGSPDALRRVRRDAVGPPRAGLDAAFAAAGDSMVRLAWCPTEDQRRIFAELIPTLPGELGGGPSVLVLRDLRWAVGFLSPGPGLSSRLILQARDAESARALADLARKTLPVISDGRRRLQALPEGATPPQFEVEGDLVVARFDRSWTAAVVGITTLATAAARRAESVDNLKQLGLAFHNYHASKDVFPPAFTRSPDGKPLLSWRVHLLPYLDQGETLYKQFHLDEAWDSPHNATLIARMPKPYASPASSPDVRRSGRTTYLAPRGRSTVLDGGAGIPIAQVTDGTSNTILAAEVGDKLAVEWTRPDDWSVDPEPIRDGLFGHHLGGTNFLFCDGSVRFIRESVPQAILKKLVTRDRGEVVSPDDY